MGDLIGLVAVLLPVMIVGMALTYKFFTRLYFPETRREGVRGSRQRGCETPLESRPEEPSYHELMAKCMEYQRRIQNLEDILSEHGKTRERS